MELSNGTGFIRGVCIWEIRGMAWVDGGGGLFQFLPYELEVEETRVADCFVCAFKREFGFAVGTNAVAVLFEHNELYVPQISDSAAKTFSIEEVTFSGRAEEEEEEE